jgi:hypothetical protein
VPNALAEAIVKGDHDDDLDTIDRALRARRELIARSQLVSVAIGSKVRLKDRPDLRPEYLRGLTGKVTNRGSKNLSVDFDDKEAARRYRGGIRIPADFIEVIS